MEDVLDVYELPFDEDVPVVCMDEKPYQLLDESRPKLPMRPGDDEKIDFEYVRKGTCSIFAFIEPLAGIHHVSVREHRTAKDWAEEIRYKAFPPEEARRILRKLEIHYTPKHGSWLNVAEIELHVMTQQCLSRRIPDIELLRKELSAWESDRNNSYAKVSWHFRSKDAREKLASLYPSLD